MSIERVDSGIKNLDRMTGGGIPREMIILVEGEPGSGKSNFGLEYLYRGVQKGENGLYVSFQDTKNEVKRTTTFDWNFDQKVDEKEINVQKFDPYRYEKISDMLRSAVLENDASRVVIDPITDLDLYIDSRKDQRKNLLEIKQELKDLNCTSLLLAEEKESTELEEELVDGIIQMRLSRGDEGMKRHIFVKKLKGTDFNHSVHRYVFKNDGIKIR
ncbi:MAG: RAD55 family ATPase [Candidatus Nanohaloarchaea archaeon]